MQDRFYAEMVYDFFDVFSNIDKENIQPSLRDFIVKSLHLLKTLDFHPSYTLMFAHQYVIFVKNKILPLSSYINKNDNIYKLFVLLTCIMMSIANVFDSDFIYVMQKHFNCARFRKYLNNFRQKTSVEELFKIIIFSGGDKSD